MKVIVSYRIYNSVKHCEYVDMDKCGGEYHMIKVNPFYFCFFCILLLLKKEYLPSVKLFELGYII